MMAVCVVTVGLVVTTSLGSAYNESRPQRLMVFHTRRTVHAPASAGDVGDTVENFYWIPELDANTLSAVNKYGESTLLVYGIQIRPFQDQG